MGLTKLWILNGTKPFGGIAGNRVDLQKRGIEFLEGEVNSINLTGREARVGKLQLRYDYLVIALGAEYSTASTPGFSQHAHNLYTESGCAEIRDQLRNIGSGTVNLMVCGLPFKCPPAPYEASMIIDDVLRKRGVRERIMLRIITPEPHPLTILGSKAGELVKGLLAERSIDYQPSQKVKEIRRNLVITENGTEFPHDLAIAVPVHICPQVMKETDLVDQSGWVAVDPLTLATKEPGVYAIGDSAGTKIPKGLLLPRAGVLAEEQARVVAANIISEIKGETPTAQFNGKGKCIVEVGDGKAAPVHADFYAQPDPIWEFTPPSAEGFKEKQRFLTERMERWFN